MAQIGMWNKIARLTGSLLLGILFVGCKEDPKNGNNGTHGQTPPDSQKVTQPSLLGASFSGDSAYFFTEKQVSFGPRTPGSKAHTDCLAWLKSKFLTYTPHVTVQESSVKAYDGKTLPIRNVIAEFNPENANRILVSSHWDSRPWADQEVGKTQKPVPGANDGASGVGILVEIARQLQSKAPSIGVDLILWDTEDYGDYETEHTFCYGSQHWSKNPHKPGYKARFGINLDMVGAKNAQFLQESYSLERAGQQNQLVWNTASKLGYSNFFLHSLNSYPVVDDHLYVMDNAGIPMVEIIDRDINSGSFFPHWHKTTDDMTQISKETLKAVGHTVLEVLYSEK